MTIRSRRYKTNVRDSAFSIIDEADPSRVVKFDLNGVPPATTVVLDLPGTSGDMITRESVPDMGNMAAPATASFTAQWGAAYRIDAAAGNLLVTIPDATSANANQFISLHRVDVSANTVTVVVASLLSQTFFQIMGDIDAPAFTMRTGQTVNIRSIGTFPVVTNYAGVDTVRRLWVPTDAGVAPVLWYDVLDGATLTLAGSDITNMANKGTAAGYHLQAESPGQRPALVGVGAGQYADFSNDALITASAVAPAATSELTYVMMYQQTAAANVTQFAQALTSRFSMHAKWGDGVTYIDAPILSRISANLGSDPIGANPHVGLMRKGATPGRQYFMDGNTTVRISAAGAGNALAGTGVFRIGSEAGPVNQFTGRFYEYLLYNYALTNDERDRVQAYSFWRRGLQSLLHESNPYKAAPPTVNLRTF